MELKRGSFPRFYFLSNDELIDILANSTNLDIIQQHMKTCFDNIVKIDIVDGIDIEAMNSGEKEKVKFKKNLKARGQVELWLDALQGEMINTLWWLLKAGVADYDNQERTKFVQEHKGQIVATVCQIMWRRQSEIAIEEQGLNPLALQDWLDINIQQIEQLTALVRGELSDILRRIIVALVTVDVHARDIVDELKGLSVSSINEFKWL
jgi:dynein heavy chain